MQRADQMRKGEGMRFWKASLIVLGCLAAGACGSSGSKPKVTVTVSPGAVSLPIPQTFQFQAAVGGATDQTVVWKVNDVVGGNAATTGSISTTGFYTAPAAIPNPATVTIKATSNADSTVSGTATVTLTSGVVLTLVPLTATVGTGETLPFFATITGNTNTGVNWSVNGTAGGSATTGTITTMTSGGNPATYTAPAAIPTGGSVMVKAVSAVDASQMATATVTRTVMATAMEALNMAATTATVMAPDTAIAATPEWPSYSAGSPVPVITVDPLTAFSARRRVEQFAPTSAITKTQADLVLPGRLVRTGAVSIAFSFN